MKKTQNIVAVTVIGIGALAVLYLSWVSSPLIGRMRFMPSWLATWVDSYDFIAIRTAIPLVALGLMTGLFLNAQKRNTFWWLIAWLILSLLVVFAELGQYFRPMRSVDWKDMVWGSVGAAFGLGMVYLAREIWCFITRQKLK